MILKEGISDIFKDMPSLGQFKDDAYRYLVVHNSSLLDRIDKTRFDTERINDIDNPRYFIGGPNKNRFQLPNRISTDKTQLYFRFSIKPSVNKLELEIGMNLKTVDKMQIEPYTNINIKITEFINNWTNYDWSNEMKYAVRHFEKKLGINKKNRKLDFESLLDELDIDIDELSKKIYDKLDDKRNLSNFKAVKPVLKSIFDDNTFGEKEYTKYSYSSIDVLKDNEFISKLCDAVSKTLDKKTHN